LCEKKKNQIMRRSGPEKERDWSSESGVEEGADKQNNKTRSGPPG